LILLDPHVLLWLDSDAPQLGVQARQEIQEAWQADQVAVSVISFWEAAMLQQRGRIALAATPATWRDDWQAAGLKELPLTGSVALAAVALQGFHADPADRFITATALEHNALLITADQAILNWPDRSLNRLDARH
jgi:PIN domain nuclease of toxin-antitoxin system